MGFRNYKNKICCCIGHRKIEITCELKREIYDHVENLIVLFVVCSKNRVRTDGRDSLKKFGNVKSSGNF